jgi:hypothetical protein
MLLGISEGVASVQFHQTGKGALNSREIMNESMVQMKDSRSRGFLQSALETGMSKVIADVLGSLEVQDNSITTPSEADTGEMVRWAPRSAHHNSQLVKTTTARSIMEKKTIFGTVRLHTRNYKISSPGPTSSEDEETTSHLTIRPAPWVVALGLQYGINMTFSQSSTSWKHMLQTFRPVQDDAEIFKQVKWYDEEEVSDLISQGKASIWDTNKMGRTP